MKKLLSIKNKGKDSIDVENVKLLRAELEYWKAKYVAATTGAGKSNLTTQRNPWLDNMESLLHSKPNYVKYLVSCGKILMNDTDRHNKTLLITAAQTGHYDIVQLCVNLGANIDFKDDSGKTAIDRARAGAWYHCEELLLFSQLSVNVSDRVKNTAFSMNKQNGITENIINEMDNVIKDKNDKDKFVHTLAKILCNIINKKLPFSDDLLIYVGFMVATEVVIVVIAQCQMIYLKHYSIHAIVLLPMVIKKIGIILKRLFWHQMYVCYKFHW